MTNFDNPNILGDVAPEWVTVSNPFSISSGNSGNKSHRNKKHQHISKRMREEMRKKRIKGKN